MADPKMQRIRRSVFNSRYYPDEELLIQFVASKPVLYDKTLKAHRKRNTRQQAWMQVSKEMGDIPVEDCQKRWRSLRDAFTKHFKFNIKTDQEETVKRKKWIFYDQMMFLAPFLERSL